MLNKIRVDNRLIGFLLGGGLILVSSGIIYTVMTIMGIGFEEDTKIYMFSFIPTILLMRWYFKLRFTRSANSSLLSLVIGVLIYSLLIRGMGGF